MIRAYLEEAVKKIEAEREQKVALVKDRLVREKIAQHNAEIDGLRAKALAEIDGDLNVKIASLRKEYEEKKQKLIAMGEEDKRAHAEEVFATELAVLTVDYDHHIAKLKAQLAELKE